MSTTPDPRVEAAETKSWQHEALIAADAADAKLSIYRIKVDDAAVERVAREMWRQRALGSLQPHYKWENLAPEGRERGLEDARAVIEALKGATP